MSGVAKNELVSARLPYELQDILSHNIKVPEFSLREQLINFFSDLVVITDTGA